MKARDVLTVACIAATSLTAGSIFCFPLFGPALTRDLGLNLTQTNTIWGGAVLGEYLTGGIWGLLADWYGPRVLSISAGLLFLVGYQLISHADVVALNVDAITDGGLEGGDRPMAWGMFVLTVASFAGIGAAVAASYFAAVTASTRLFRTRPGLAIAGPLTLFSLSSLFLTSVGITFFSDHTSGDLRAPSFLSFLGALLGVTNFFSAIFMDVKPPQEKAIVDGRALEWDTDGEGPHVNERTSLLSTGDREAHEATVERPLLPGVPDSQSVSAFLLSPPVWALGLLMLVGVGAGEMVLSSVGNMVVSLLGNHTAEGKTSPSAASGVLYLAAAPGIGPIALSIRANQVKLLAAANTLSRLLGGLLSDVVAPSATRGRGTGDFYASHQPSLMERLAGITISRLTLLLFAILLSLAAYVWAAFGMATVDSLPAFSIAVGVSYGLVFTLVPAVVVASFGTEHFGRNWGLLTYCCAVGSLTYSLLYATVSDAVASREGEHRGGHSSDGSPAGSGGATCLAGPACFQPSFIVALIGMVFALVALLPVWRSWRSHL
ncbi:hypothetical protein BCV69DRAFT_96920 [Microstroma glucosiphilum]|uniref:MFS general substrate transporter n=1 Tax=Pseudomicrostroma glucosiphilum TaxID=1684307 RepID=A0A316UD09_9BASI|nr:hypothetical protein BCV69DRAFT_96920 [Pseudomicrostroma glucosiphilum]PWN22768.1 hypothetical protein BCV69DRAFT_96920 [Pseudomicrostroma glucosiphilum]